MPIRVLDKSVAELIAAGEVIERPASVAKELIENSIDAGAKSITVEIKNGGISFLRVSDDGAGIPFDEVSTAFLRHATSKVAISEDLEQISTLGFRGEALASVSMVSRVSLLTKTEGESTGTSYKIEGGVQVDHERAGCPDGTTVIIRDLFFNTPARLKFLKKDVSEGNSVQGVVNRAALINPQISFRFIRDNCLGLVTPGDDKLYSAIYAVLGKSFATSMLAVKGCQNGISVNGYVSSPMFCRNNRVFQYFYVNSRYIRSSSCVAAVEEGFRNSMMTGKFPACVLNIGIEPSYVDVNVHPAKTEVRFSNGKAVFDAVYFSVKNALLNAGRDVVSPANIPVVKQGAEKTAELKKERIDEAKTFGVHNGGSPATLSFHSHKTEYIAESGLNRRKKTDDGEIAALPFDDFKHISSESFQTRQTDVEDSPAGTPEPALLVADIKGDDIDVIGEIFSTYIICEHKDSMVLIDKHAADERLRFERLKGELKSHSQILIERVEVGLDAEGYSALSEASEVLEKIGISFVLPDKMDFTVMVTAMPSILDSGKTAEIITEIAEKLKLGVIEGDGIFDGILHSIACRAAIKAGDKSVARDIEQLARRVIKDPGLRYCPHGRPTAVTLTKRDFEKMFKRIP